MYQFTTTTVINSNLDSNGTTAKYAGSALGLNITRLPFYKKNNIVSLYKRAYQAGAKEVAHVTVPTVTAGLVVRLYVDVRLSQQTESEYANTYLYFKKPIAVEVIATGTAATDAAALIAQLNYIKTEFGYQYVVASSGGGAVIVLTATNNNQRFYNAQILQEQDNVAYPNSLVDPQYTDVTGGTFAVTSAGVVGFGDDEYMIRSIMLPTLENTRYFGINKEERPIIGGNYSQYTLRYSLVKDGDDGIVGGRQSITTHVFYVLSSLVTGFETALTNAGITIEASIPGAGGFVLTAPNTNISVGDTVQLAPVGAIGAVTYVSATTATATVASTGLVTSVATGTTVVTATDSTGSTATITITVFA